MTKISERIHHLRVDEGYCLICGNFGRLSQDHVPPRGAECGDIIEQFHVSEHHPTNLAIKGVYSRNGSYFKTICETCNNVHVGGEHDAEIANICRAVKEMLDKGKAPTLITVPVRPIPYARAMIGHILSATSSQHCHQPPCDSPYFSPLQRFVLGDDHALDYTHDIHYWFYPFTGHSSGKYVHFQNQGHRVGLSILAFFPVALMVTEKGRGIYPAHAHQLHFNTGRLFLDIDPGHQPYASFPFGPLEGDQICLFEDSQAVASRPAIDVQRP